MPLFHDQGRFKVKCWAWARKSSVEQFEIFECFSQKKAFTFVVQV